MSGSDNIVAQALRAMITAGQCASKLEDERQTHTLCRTRREIARPLHAHGKKCSALSARPHCDLLSCGARSLQRPRHRTRKIEVGDDRTLFHAGDQECKTKNLEEHSPSEKVEGVTSSKETARLTQMRTPQHPRKATSIVAR